jgi:hypothetical protein
VKRLSASRPANLISPPACCRLHKTRHLYLNAFAWLPGVRTETCPLSELCCCPLLLPSTSCPFLVLTSSQVLLYQRSSCFTSVARMETYRDVQGEHSRHPVTPTPDPHRTRILNNGSIVRPVRWDSQIDTVRARSRTRVDLRTCPPGARPALHGCC